MEVILLERIDQLGQMGDLVSVKDGYARNYLLPQKKALRATKENRKRFERGRVQLEADNLVRRQEAEAVAERMAGLAIVMVRQAGDTGQLYGSVSPRDIAAGVTGAGFTIAHARVALDRAIKTLGLHRARIILHPEVALDVTVNVARSEEEARLQAEGVDVTVGEREEAAEMFEEEEAAPTPAEAEDEAEPASGEPKPEQPEA
jgi:large subunit ribosomal protein L9